MKAAVYTRYGPLDVVYVTLGIFLLPAVRNASAHRSVIAFAAWSSLLMLLSWLSWSFTLQTNAEICWSPGCV